MKKYGEFVIMPCDFNRFAVVAVFTDQRIDLSAGSINEYGTIIKIVQTMDKAYRLVKKYEQRMGRTP